MFFVKNIAEKFISTTFIQAYCVFFLVIPIFIPNLLYFNISNPISYTWNKYEEGFPPSSYPFSQILVDFFPIYGPE